MKKVFLLATAAFLFTGLAFANSGDGKKCTKDCCKDKKECADMKNCKDKGMKDCKMGAGKENAKATKTSTKTATKA